MLLYLIIAAASVGLVAWRPGSAPVALTVATGAAVEVALGVPWHAVGVVLPLLAFLSAALTLAALVERSGLTPRAAATLARVARGSTPALYALVCGVCATLTCVVSLDGAVVLMVPLVLGLAERLEVPTTAFFLGVVVVANAFSIAVPQGNPTNLVVMNSLGLSTGEFLAHMALPGIGAAVICAAAVAMRERGALRRGYRAAQPGRRVSRDERHAEARLSWRASSFGPLRSPAFPRGGRSPGRLRRPSPYSAVGSDRSCRGGSRRRSARCL